MRAGRSRAVAALITALALTVLLLMTVAGAHAQSDPAQTYTVVAGDTLFTIAQRFNISLEELVIANSIADPNLLAVGQILVIPAPGQAITQAGAAATAAIATEIVHAHPGDTLSAVAGRYQQSPDLLAGLNGLTVTTPLFPGQPLLAQAPITLPESSDFGAVLAVAPPPDVVQGRTGRLVVESRRPLDLAATWNDLPLVFTPLAGNSLSQYALVPTPALLTPAPYTLTVAYTATNGARLARTWFVPVRAGDYESQIIELTPEVGALLDPALVQSELEKVTALWSHVSPTLLWSQPFTRPIDVQYETTSPFGTRRGYQGGPITGYHAGQDFGVPAGVTVTAPADGIVVLAEPLKVRGNAVILDHGRGIFTGYWHLSEIKVTPGQSVRAGDPLGLSGNTGLSTGAHLHWELRIYGIAVDPMQFVSEPFPPAAANLEPPR